MSENSVKKDDSKTETIRVSVEILDKLMNQVGELVLVRNQFLRVDVDNITQNAFSHLSQRLNVVTGEIQDQIMLTRMQPVGKVLTKFNRVVRDIAQNVGKQIELRLEGVDTELDKSLIEAIKDPLTHIVRNSCDHGLEVPEEREKAGKSPIGLILIRSFHEGGQVIIEISDNGRGLNRERLINKAVANGILPQAQADTISDREAYQLIFHPGLSTADKVSNLSGRGVGMDVVKSNIEAIGGNIELDSKPGVGTTLKLKIPLTLAIMPALIVKSQGLVFSIPQVKLVELIRVETEGEHHACMEELQGQPVYRLRGDLLPLVNLNQVLSGGSDNTPPETVNIVVLRSDIAVFGLIVDEILDSADIVVKPLVSFLKPISVYAGATVMGDGDLALVLDVNGLAGTIKLNNSSRGGDAATADQSETLQGLKEYLVVDIGEQNQYAIQLELVSRLEEVPRHKIERQGEMRVLQYRGILLPILSLLEELQMSPAAGDDPLDAKDTLNIVVINNGGHLFGLEVSDIIEVVSSHEDVDFSIRDRVGILGNLVYQNKVYIVMDVIDLIEHSSVYLAQKPPQEFREAS